MNEKKYGDPDFGCTLDDLKAHAELAQTVAGVSFEGNARKVGAILAVAGAGSEMIAEIEQLQAQRNELLAALTSLVLFSKPTKTNAVALNNAHRVIAKYDGIVRQNSGAAHGPDITLPDGTGLDLARAKAVQS